MREAVHHQDYGVERGDRIGRHGDIGLSESILRVACMSTVDEKSAPFAAQTELVTVELLTTDSERPWLTYLLTVTLSTCTCCTQGYSQGCVAFVSSRPVIGSVASICRQRSVVRGGGDARTSGSPATRCTPTGHHKSMSAKSLFAHVTQSADFADFPYVWPWGLSGTNGI
jgi:hypothetical protein